MNYTEALQYIHSVSWKGSMPGLSRIRALCDAMGNPERDLSVIHVAGTNGKGSTCYMIASVLKIFFSFVSYCVKQKIGCL